MQKILSLVAGFAYFGLLFIYFLASPKYEMFTNFWARLYFKNDVGGRIV